MGVKPVDNDTKQLIIDVMDGNPGALTIIRQLMTFATWHQILHHLRGQGLVGTELWRVVNDDFQHDYQAFVNMLLSRMTPQRAQALRSLDREQAFRSN
jgi:hypothetical protein